MKRIKCPICKKVFLVRKKIREEILVKVLQIQKQPK